MSEHHHADELDHRHELQPSSQMCFVCGVSNPIGLKSRFYSVGDNQVELRLTFTDPYQGYPGITHGGIIATILDETMGRAVLASSLERLMMTAKMEIKYRLSVPLNTEILFRGIVTKDKGRIAQAEGYAILPDGSIAVEANGTLMQIPTEKLSEMNTAEVGWRIYEDHEIE